MSTDYDNLASTKQTGWQVYEPSVVQHEGIQYFLVEATGGQRQLAVKAPTGSTQLAHFVGVPSSVEEDVLLLCPLNAYNAAALRKQLSWLRPSVQGLQTGVGAR